MVTFRACCAQSALLAVIVAPLGTAGARLTDKSGRDEEPLRRASVQISLPNAQHLNVCVVMILAVLAASSISTLTPVWVGNSPSLGEESAK